MLALFALCQCLLSLKTASLMFHQKSQLKESFYDIANHLKQSGQLFVFFCKLFPFARGLSGSYGVGKLRGKVCVVWTSKKLSESFFLKQWSLCYSKLEKIWRSFTELSISRLPAWHLAPPNFLSFQIEIGFYRRNFITVSFLFLLVSNVDDAVVKTRKNKTNRKIIPGFLRRFSFATLSLSPFPITAFEK